MQRTQYESTQSNYDDERGSEDDRNDIYQPHTYKYRLHRIKLNLRKNIKQIVHLWEVDTNVE